MSTRLINRFLAIAISALMHFVFTILTPDSIFDSSTIAMFIFLREVYFRSVFLKLWINFLKFEDIAHSVKYEFKV